MITANDPSKYLLLVMDVLSNGNTVVPKSFRGSVPGVRVVLCEADGIREERVSFRRISSFRAF